MSSFDDSALRRLTAEQKRQRARWLEQEPGLNVEPLSAAVTDEFVTVKLSDGRIILYPTAEVPRLVHATPEERANAELWDSGVVWPDVEADLSIRGLLLGLPNGENPDWFDFWLENRRRGVRVTFIEWSAKREHDAQSNGPQDMETTAHA